MVLPNLGQLLFDRKEVDPVSFFGGFLERPHHNMLHTGRWVSLSLEDFYWKSLASLRDCKPGEGEANVATTTFHK